MSSLSLAAMRDYLRRSFASFNRNKLNGVLAEIDFRAHLAALGFQDRVSVGGWIARSEARGGIPFGATTVALFPEIMVPGTDYSLARPLPNPSLGLHTICSTFHQLGIHSYYSAPQVATENDPMSTKWQAIQLALPNAQQYRPLTDVIQGFTTRTRRYNFLSHNSDLAMLPDARVPEEFSKENLRITLQNRFYSEISDIDGLFWGERHTYPVEIKEKTPAPSTTMGPFFGLDVGPFVKLAFYAAKRGNLHSLFIVREIDHEETRNLVNWWYVTFDDLAQFASWNFSAGGTPMGGRGRSATVRIPKSVFKTLDAAALQAL